MVTRPFIHRSLLLASLCLLPGCATIHYYGQAIGGHLDLMARGRSIQGLVDDTDTDKTLRHRLALVLAIREFAHGELELPDNGSYRRYSELQRPYVLWQVVAAPEFSVDAQQWCYPVVGCAAYRGYYAERAAHRFAERLAGRGLDVAVDGVPAYSTLGWFSDPLPSTVIAWPETHLAGLIFHELAHQRLYIKGDTAFNETFATAVARIGVQRWLEHNADDEAGAHYQQAIRREDEFVGLLLATRQRLTELYARDLPSPDMRAGKRRVFEDLRRDYEALKRGWEGYAEFDPWFERPLNNARLAAVAAYHERIPAFLALYAQQGGDMGAFYAACEQLGKLPLAQRSLELARQLAQPGG